MVDCYVADAEGPFAPDVRTILGFSADEVLATLNVDVPVVATRAGEEAREEHPVRFRFSAPRDVRIERRAEAGPHDGGWCVTGTQLTFEADLAIASDDGWLSGAGTVWVLAAGTSADRIHLFGSVPLAAGDDLGRAIHERINARVEGAIFTRYHLWWSPKRVGLRSWAESRGLVAVESGRGSGELYALAPADFEDR